MRFEHLIEINTPRSTAQGAAGAFTREQLWQGLMVRVLTPQRFPHGPDRCDCVQAAPDRIARTLHFGAHVFNDEVMLEPLVRMQFTPQAHGDTAPIALSIHLEGDKAPSDALALRFVYVALSEQTPDEARYNEYRHNAWLHNDQDMVNTLRQWLDQGLLA